MSDIDALIERLEWHSNGDSSIHEACKNAATALAELRNENGRLQELERDSYTTLLQENKRLREIIKGRGREIDRLLCKICDKRYADCTHKYAESEDLK